MPAMAGLLYLIHSRVAYQMRVLVIFLIFRFNIGKFSFYTRGVAKHVFKKSSLVEQYGCPIECSRAYLKENKNHNLSG